MKYVNDSLSIVFVGDWNNLYLQPEWISNNIFEVPQIEIGVFGIGIDVEVSFKYNDIIIKPNRDKIIISTTNISDQIIEQLAKCASNFITRSSTPQNVAYGYNITYIDSEDMQLAETFDRISDSSQIVDLGYEIISSNIHRKIMKDEKIINIDCLLENSNSKFIFNEHHDEQDVKNIFIDKNTINGFLGETKSILIGMGYEIEEE